MHPGDGFAGAWHAAQGQEGQDGEQLPELKVLGSLLEQLPPMLARKRVEHVLGGAVSERTLANADSRGRGPRGRFYVGRTVVYPTIYLLEWLEKKGLRPVVRPGYNKGEGR